MTDNTTSITPSQLRGVYSVQQFAEKYPSFSVGMLRNLIHFEDTNGFSAVIRRIGRRIFIIEEAFFEWLDAGQ